MKIFDYKFFILLALTFVVYFMCKEILELRSKIYILEDKVNNFQIENKKPIEKAQIMEIPLPQNTKLIPQYNDVLLKSNYDKTETESETISQSSKIEKLEIYSNDNPENNDISLDSTSEIHDISIDSTSEKNNIILENNYDLSENNNYSLNSTSEINLEEIEEGIILQERNEKTNSAVESERVDVIENITTDEYKMSENNYTYNDLMKMKLSQLQCMAEEFRISLQNTDKGKKKTKKELSNDLVLYYQK